MNDSSTQMNEVFYAGDGKKQTSSKLPRNWCSVDCQMFATTTAVIGAINCFKYYMHSLLLGNVLFIWSCVTAIPLNLHISFRKNFFCFQRSYFFADQIHRINSSFKVMMGPGHFFRILSLIFMISTIKYLCQLNNGLVKKGGASPVSCFADWGSEWANQSTNSWRPNIKSRKHKIRNFLYLLWFCDLFVSARKKIIAFIKAERERSPSVPSHNDVIKTLEWCRQWTLWGVYFAIIGQYERSMLPSLDSKYEMNTVMMPPNIAFPSHTCKMTYIVCTKTWTYL